MIPSIPPAKWLLKPAPDPALERQLAEELGCPAFLARLLAHRGFATAAEARLFLEPKLKNLSDPFLLPEMRPAIDRILLAIDRHERIALYGDYDVDGVTSLALFTRVLRQLGADPRPRPCRLRFGLQQNQRPLPKLRHTTGSAASRF